MASSSKAQCAGWAPGSALSASSVEDRIPCPALVLLSGRKCDKPLVMDRITEPPASHQPLPGGSTASPPPLPAPHEPHPAGPIKLNVWPSCAIRDNTDHIRNQVTAACGSSRRLQARGLAQRRTASLRAAALRGSCCTGSLAEQAQCQRLGQAHDRVQGSHHPGHVRLRAGRTHAAATTATQSSVVLAGAGLTRGGHDGVGEVRLGGCTGRIPGA